MSHPYPHAAVAHARQKSAAMTHCKNGHALTPDNVRPRHRIQNGRPYTIRECIACRNLWGKRLYASKAKARKRAAREAQRKERQLAKEARRAAPLRYVEFRAELFMQLLTEGLSINMILYGRRRFSKQRVKGVGTRSLFEEYCAQNPEWADRARALAVRNAQISHDNKGKNPKNFTNKTHCSKGHALTPENVGFKPSNGTRYCKTCNVENVRRGKPMTAEQERAIRNWVLTGGKLQGIWKGEPGRSPICTNGTYTTARLQNAEFNRFIVENLSGTSRGLALRSRAGRLITDIASLAAAPAIIRRAEAIPPYIARQGDYERLYSLTPRWLSDDDRKDIVSNIFVALTERRLRIEDVPSRLREFCGEHYKLFPSSSENGRIRTPYSLDKPIFLDGKTTRADVSAIGLWSEEAIY